MNSVLEQQRRLHEERERIEDAILKELLLKKTSVRDAINADHRIADLVHRNADASQRLLGTYEDRDGLREEEIGELTGTDEFREFYWKLKVLRTSNWCV